MTTTADLVRERIQQSIRDVHNLPTSERMEALWMDVDTHLKAADLCEVLGEYSQMTSHLDTINMLLENHFFRLRELCYNSATSDDRKGMP